MTWLGDFRVSQTVRFWWNSNAIAGESITRATNGTISVYKDGSDTQSTSGVTDGEDSDSLTGVHRGAIDLSSDGTFYSAGSDFAIVLSGATIDGKSINAVLAQFSIENRSALMPTTAGRKLDVSAGGEAGIDWANVGSPTTAVNLSGTTVKTATDVETDTQDIQSRLPAALGANGNIKADVRDYNGTAGTFASGRPEVNTTHAAGTAWGSGAITAASIAADAITAAKIANGAIDAATFAADVDAEILSYIVDDATRIDASALNTLSSHDPGETIMGATDLGTGAGLTSLATAAALAVVDGIVDDILLDTAEIGAAGAGLTNINLPNQTMDIVGNITGNVTGSVGSVTGLTAANLDVAVSTRLASASYTAPANATIAAIDAKTTNLPSDPADQSLIIAATNGIITAIGDLETHGDSTWATATGFSTHSADDVWSVGTRVLTASTNLGDLDDALISLINGLSLGDVAVQVAEMWQKDGLDPVNPASFTPTAFTFGAITIDVTGDGIASTTLTRAP